jgi:tyrosyl-tRNA synthetase
MEKINHMKQTLKMVVILIMPLLTQVANCQSTNQVKPQPVNNSIQAKEFSLVDYLRENPDEANIRYQAYLRVRLTACDDSLQQKLYAETEKIKSELAQNTINYSKLAYKETLPPKSNETADKDLAKNANEKELSKVVVNN